MTAKAIIEALTVLHKEATNNNYDSEEYGNSICAICPNEEGWPCQTRAILDKLGKK